MGWREKEEREERVGSRRDGEYKGGREGDKEDNSKKGGEEKKEEEKALYVHNTWHDLRRASKTVPMVAYFFFLLDHFGGYFYGS